ncbi:MAG: NosD domain-containing protein, partial [Candidatus Thermoplasmatota archaeon]|nr:NosD domain-containing protein [Candidatus Thermoplasmatota archaeon]
MVKMRNTLVMLIMGLIFVSVFTVFLPVEIGVASGNTIYVDNGNTAGPWNGTQSNPYQYIQDGINAANESDTVYVYSGTYNENIVVNKSLTLSGEGSGSTTINGEGGQHTAKVTSDNVTISGFKIKNTDGGSYACIQLWHVINCKINDIIAQYGGNTLYLVESNTNTIEDNTIESGNIGIFFSNSDSNIITNNYIQNSNAYGISLYSNSAGNIIYKNDFSNNLLSNARDLSSNIWSHNSQGNYWDDYNDYDSDGNGIGDNPYVIDGDSQDDYPLGDFLSSNQEPVAYIDSVSPNPATQEQTVNFNGHGTDDGTILEWEWKSNLEAGTIGASSSFSTSSLSVGTHTIKFRVKDDDDQWSDYAQETLIINPQDSQNKKPDAEIVTINPDNADYEESVYFHGLGTDSDGIVMEYKWRSSKDGVLSNESTFTKSDLPVGTHTIYFKVKDDQGEWSSEDSSSLVINPSPTPENEPPTANAGGPY